MSPAQRCHFFGRLWPAACAVQGWSPKDDAARRRVIFAATGEESMSGLDEDQITLLFIKVRWLADPANFDKALADSDPAAALDEHKRKQIIWRIEQAAAQIPGDPEAWLADIAADRHGTRAWRHLPTAELRRFAFTVGGKTTSAAQERRRFKQARKKAPARAVQKDCSADAEAPVEMPF